MKVDRISAYAPESAKRRLIPAGVGRVPIGFSFTLTGLLRHHD